MNGRITGTVRKWTIRCASFAHIYVNHKTPFARKIIVCNPTKYESSAIDIAGMQRRTVKTTVLITKTAIKRNTQELRQRRIVDARNKWINNWLIAVKTDWHRRALPRTGDWKEVWCNRRIDSIYSVKSHKAFGATTIIALFCYSLIVLLLLLVFYYEIDDKRSRTQTLGGINNVMNHQRHQLFDTTRQHPLRTW